MDVELQAQAMYDEDEQFSGYYTPHRYGGPQAICDEDDEDQAEGEGDGDGEEDEEKRRREDRERKKAEVRRRLEEAGRAKNVKRGFLTPDRKKKLRQLLLAKAAEDLKQQQVMKEQERQRYLESRIPQMPNIDSMGQGELESMAKTFWDQIVKLEDQKYDLEYNVRQKDFELNELSILVNDLRGKFVKPTLKKVNKYDTKFDKLQTKKEDKVNFREGLKNVKQDKFSVDAIMKDKEKDNPEWAQK